MPTPELERIVDRRLKALPAPRAPHTLLPRVMRAVEDLTRCVRRPLGWFAWPMLWRVASGVALALVIVTLVSAWPQAVTRFETIATQVSVPVAGVWASLERVARVPSALAGATAAVWRTLLLPPDSSYLLVFVALMLAACALGGAALRSLALEGHPRP
jgi:hypothetical protein